jgi:nucleoporin NUP42
MGLGGNAASTTAAPANPFGARPTAPAGGSVFGASTASNAPVSAFGASTTAPANPFGGASRNQAAPQTSSAFSQFNAAASVSRPVKDLYASQLPQNYMEMLPPDVKEAFERDRFIIGEGSVGVPTWIPPLEMR